MEGDGSHDPTRTFFDGDKCTVSRSSKKHNIYMERMSIQRCTEIPQAPSHTEYGRGETVSGCSAFHAFHRLHPTLTESFCICIYIYTYCTCIYAGLLVRVVSAPVLLDSPRNCPHLCLQQPLVKQLGHANSNVEGTRDAKQAANTQQSRESLRVTERL